MSTVPNARVAVWPRPERLLRNVLSNSAASALGAAAQLAAIAVASQCLATGAYADYLVAIALVGVAEMGSDFGARVWAVQQFALGVHPPRVLRVALAAKGICSAAMLVLLVAAPSSGLSRPEALLCALVAMTQPSSDPALWYLRGVGRLDIEAAFTLASRCGAAALACAIALAGGGVPGILAAWLACNAARMLAVLAAPGTKPLFASVPRRASRHVAGPRTAQLASSHHPRLRDALTAMLPLGASLILISLFQRAGVLLMDSLGTPRDVALFGTSYKFVSTTSLVATSMALASFPELARHIQARRTGQAGRILEHQILSVTLLFAPLALAGIVVGPWLGEAVLGPGLSAAGMVLAALMPGLYISSINIATKFTLNALGQNWREAAYALIALAAFCGVFYAPVGGSPCLRAAVAWAAGELLIFWMRARTIRRASSELRVSSLLVLGTLAALSIAAAARWHWS